jgi:hypothetical protein
MDTIFNTWAQDGGYLPDLPGFPSGTYAQVAAVGVKIHGYLSATEMHPETGDRKRFIRMTYYGPTDTYARMGICSLYTDPATVARYANPSKEDGRDVIKERRSIKYYRRDGSGGGYSLWYYKAGAVDKLFEYEFQSEDIGMPSPGAVGRPFENLSATDSLEIKFVPKATIFTLKNEESRRPDDVMGAMLLRLEGAAGAASEEVQGIIELGSMVFDPMKAVGLAQNMGQAIVHWDQTMGAIQRQVDDTANTYWESRVGLINPEDAYRKEGAFLFHLASNVTGGWAVKGVGKTAAKLAGKVEDVGSLSGKTALWTSTKGKTLVENAFEHWQKHGAEFPEFQNAKQYVEGAESFFSSPPAGTLTKTRPNGDTLFYNPGNNTFGVQAVDGAPRTMFRPTDGINYWNKQ